MGAVTILIVWIAVTTLLRQGRLETVLSAGRAELAAPLLVALVVTTGIRERIWPAERRPVPVEQDGSAGSALLVFTEQLAGPFRARS